MSPQSIRSDAVSQSVHHEGADPGRRVSIGIDIGGTKVAGGVVTEDGAIIARCRRDTPHRSTSPAVVEDVIVEVVEDLMADLEADSVVAIGIGAAGFVAADRATVVFAPTCRGGTSPCGTGSASGSTRPSSSTTTPTRPRGPRAASGRPAGRATSS